MTYGLIPSHDYIKRDYSRSQIKKSTEDGAMKKVHKGTNFLIRNLEDIWNFRKYVGELLPSGELAEFHFVKHIGTKEHIKKNFFKTLTPDAPPRYVSGHIFYKLYIYIKQEKLNVYF